MNTLDDFWRARKIVAADAICVSEYMQRSYSFVPGPLVKYRQIAGMAQDIALAVKAHGPVFITNDSASGRIKITWQADSVLAQPLPIHPQPYKLPLGIAMDGSHRTLLLPNCPHVLVAGTSGSGKSYWMRNAVSWAVAQSFVVEIFDPKYTEFADCRPLPRVTHTADPEAVLQRAADLVACMDDRYRYLASIGQINAVSAMQAGYMVTPILLVIDEYADLISKLGDSFAGLIQQLAQKGRAAGIHIVLGTQAPTAKLLNSELKANFPVRVAFRTASAVASRVILENGLAAELSGAGDGLAITEDGSVVRFRGYTKPIVPVVSPQFDIFSQAGLISQ